MTERKKLVSKLDKVFSLYIRGRDKRCVLCGKREDLNCGHLLTRNAYSTRWDEQNCACVCTGCNLRHENDASHHTLWYIKKYGLTSYEALVLMHHTTRKFKNDELQALILEYTNKVKSLEVMSDSERHERLAKKYGVK